MVIELASCLSGALIGGLVFGAVSLAVAVFFFSLRSDNRPMPVLGGTVAP